MPFAWCLSELECGTAWGGCHVTPGNQAICIPKAVPSRVANHQNQGLTLLCGAQAWQHAYRICMHYCKFVHNRDFPRATNGALAFRHSKEKNSAPDPAYTIPKYCVRGCRSAPHCIVSVWHGGCAITKSQGSCNSGRTSPITWRRRTFTWQQITRCDSVMPFGNKRTAHHV